MDTNSVSADEKLIAPQQSLLGSLPLPNFVSEKNNNDNNDFASQTFFSIADDKTETDDVPPNQPNAGLIESKALTYRAVAATFHLPLKKAAQHFGCSPSLLKKRCRALGIDRWPQRKISSMVKKIAIIKHNMQHTAPRNKNRMNNRIKQLEHEIAVIKQEKTLEEDQPAESNSTTSDTSSNCESPVPAAENMEDLTDSLLMLGQPEMWFMRKRYSHQYHRNIQAVRHSLMASNQPTLDELSVLASQSTRASNVEIATPSITDTHLWPPYIINPAGQLPRQFPDQPELLFAMTGGPISVSFPHSDCYHQ